MRALLLLLLGCGGATAVADRRVVLDSDGWRIVGDLVVPDRRPAPVAILLNKANGDRQAYAALARELARRGIASLRVDLRGHGESINRGKFVPGDKNTEAVLAGGDEDVAAARRWAKARPELDGNRIAWVGASYSAEEMAVAARKHGYDRAYVSLSPGSFSEASFAALETSGARWLFVRSDDERFVKAWLDEEVRKASPTASEVLVVPAGRAHATDILRDRPELVTRLADWLAAHI